MNAIDETIILASDHAGYDLKEALKPWLESNGFSVLDCGTYSTESVDYPDFGGAAVKALKQGKASRGILICGSGIGISIAANRHSGIRAALCHDAESASLSREHNNANMLALAARMIDVVAARDIIDAFLRTEFAGGRHQRRVEKLG